MHAFYADHFVLPLPEGHRFPMRKYSRLRDRLTAERPGVRFAEAPPASRSRKRLYLRIGKRWPSGRGKTKWSA